MQPHNPSPKDLLPKDSRLNQDSGEFETIVDIPGSEETSIKESIEKISRGHLDLGTEQVTTGNGTHVQVSEAIQMDLHRESISIESESGKRSISVRNKDTKENVRSIVSEVLELAGKDTKTASGLLSLAGQGSLNQMYKSMYSLQAFKNSSGEDHTPHFVAGGSEVSVVFRKRGRDFQVTARIVKSFSSIPGSHWGEDVSVDKGKMTMEVSVMADGNALKSGEVKLRMASRPLARISGKL